MNRVDDILDTIDAGLQSSPEQSYGSDHGGCVRDGCDQDNLEGSDFCEPCRAYMLGDTDQDPAEQHRVTYDQAGARFWNDLVDRHSPTNQGSYAGLNASIHDARWSLEFNPNDTGADPIVVHSLYPAPPPRQIEPAEVLEAMGFILPDEQAARQGLFELTAPSLQDRLLFGYPMVTVPDQEFNLGFIA